MHCFCSIRKQDLTRGRGREKEGENGGERKRDHEKKVRDKQSD
jgi:hypothetical protein